MPPATQYDSVPLLLQHAMCCGTVTHAAPQGCVYFLNLKTKEASEEVPVGARAVARVGR